MWYSITEQEIIDMEKEEKTPVNSNEEKVKEEEVKTEEAKEEVPAPEAKEEKKPVLDPEECFDLEKVENVEEVSDDIERSRVKLLASFNKSKLISRILMFIVVLAVIGAIILIFNESMALKITGYAIAGAVLVGMFIYYALSKNKFPKESKEYIKQVTGLINAYDFTDPRFSELKCYPNKKLDKLDLEVDRVYKNSSEIGSRNFISGKFDGHKFEVSENVLYSVSPERKNQRSVSFLGKYISLENNKKFEGRYIFNLKGPNAEKLVDQPNDVEDLKVVSEEDNIQVYAPNDKPIKEVFGTKFMGLLKEIKTDEKLLNAVFVFWAGHTGIYLSYDDSVTVLPFEHPFNNEAQDKYKEDLVKALEVATLKK